MAAAGATMDRERAADLDCQADAMGARREGGWKRPSFANLCCYMLLLLHCVRRSRRTDNKHGPRRIVESHPRHRPPSIADVSSVPFQTVPVGRASYARRRDGNTGVIGRPRRFGFARDGTISAGNAHDSGHWTQRNLHHRSTLDLAAARGYGTGSLSRLEKVEHHYRRGRQSVLLPQVQWPTGGWVLVMTEAMPIATATLGANGRHAISWGRRACPAVAGRSPQCAASRGDPERKVESSENRDMQQATARGPRTRLVDSHPRQPAARSVAGWTSEQ